MGGKRGRKADESGRRGAPAAETDRQAARRAREAEALKRNLGRRKSQARGRAAEDGSAEP
jgi:hypothetical protein